jgi:hypothetical protein
LFVLIGSGCAGAPLPAAPPDQAVAPPDLIAVEDLAIVACDALLARTVTCPEIDPIACEPGFDCGQRPSTLWGRLCNLGASATSGPVAGAFYIGDPDAPGAQLLCATHTAAALPPGGCERVSCLADAPGTMRLCLRADDDGQRAPVAPECDARNDVACHFDDCTLP